MAGLHRWQFTPDELQNTPSRKAGIDADKELNYRQQCANLIQDMGQRLNVTQLCINTAIVYMHRFYVFHSFTKFHRNPMASACLFLAAKVEEQPRKLEHVITWYHMCVNRDQGPLDVKSETYLEMAQELVSNENILLQTLGFDISVEHPHQNVVKTGTLVKASKDLAQTSYILATNSLHLTTMCLRIRHTVVACVCIHLACKWSNYQIPCSSEGKQWFEYVDKDTTLAELEELTNDFLTILDNCPSKLKKKILTWKSGNKADLTEEMAAMSRAEGDQPGDRRKSHAAASSSAAHKDAANQRASGSHASHSSGSGLRRVQTEPAIAQSEQKRSKKPSHPPPTHGGHHREIPGYHGKPPQQQQSMSSSSASSSSHHHKNPYTNAAGKPTHPPPSSKSRHSGHPPPQVAPPHDSRANIFEQMQSEQGGGTVAPPGGQETGSTAANQGAANRKSLPPQQHQQQRVHGQHQQKTPHGPSQRPQHSVVSPAVMATASSHKRSHAEDPKARLSHDPAALAAAGGDPGLSAKESHRHHLPKTSSHQPPGSATKGHPPVPSDKKRGEPWGLEEGEVVSLPQSSVAPVSVSIQERQEREMQEKLQHEMRKQTERSQKFEKQRRDRMQKDKTLKSPGDLRSPTETKSPRLTSPPIGGAGTGRTKSDSTSSRSDSDTTPQQHGSTRHTPTKEERLRLFMDHQNQLTQDDRKRLRRMSEELGDPKIERKPVVMLDNCFTSPEKEKGSQDPSPKSQQRPGSGKSSESNGKNDLGLSEAGDKAGNNVPTPSRTISLEKYRERKPLVPQSSTPTGGNQAYNTELNTDKPSLAMEHLASIKLQGLKPLSEILKSSDVQGSGKTGDEPNLSSSFTTTTAAAAVKPKVEAPSPKKAAKSEKLQRHDSSGRLSSGKNLVDPMKLSSQDQSFIKTENIKTEMETPAAKQPPKTSQQQQQKSLSRQSSSDQLQHRETPPTSVNLVKQEVLLSSPKKEKNIPSLKIKLGGKTMVTMSPGSSENKEVAAVVGETSSKKEHHHHGHHKEGHHRHHEKKPHKHKHRDKSKQRSDRIPTPTATVTPGEVNQETSSGGGEKLKPLKLNLKQLGMSGAENVGGSTGAGGGTPAESPFKIDNPHRSLSGTPELEVPGQGTPSSSQGTPSGQTSASGGATVKLVLQKDRSGQYSSGQKASKHSTTTNSSSSSSRHHGDKSSSSRKRVHSPAADQQRRSTSFPQNEANTPVVPLKIARNDSSASLGYELNGSRSNSPSQMELMQQQARRVEKLIEKQKKNIKKTLEQQGGSGGTPTGLTNSPRVNPQAYPP